MRIVKKALLIITLILGLIAFFAYENNCIVITRSVYSNPKIPKSFNGFTIVQISDLHNKMFGKNQSLLINKVKNLSPDIIVITGDLIDRRRFDLDSAMAFVSQAVKIAPVYYVSGNHEAWSGKYSLIKESLADAGAYILDDSSAEVQSGNDSIYILGVYDPDFLTSRYSEGTDISNMTEQLSKWADNENFKILLSHRPELFELYAENKIDLVFSGHAHGGQIRIPFIGGLIAPDQGLFPKYTRGSFTENSTTMFVSRGLGNSIFPVRLFNRPEIVAVTLKN